MLSKDMYEFTTWGDWLSSYKLTLFMIIWRSCLVSGVFVSITRFVSISIKRKCRNQVRLKINTKRNWIIHCTICQRANSAWKLRRLRQSITCSCQSSVHCISILFTVLGEYCHYNNDIVVVTWYANFVRTKTRNAQAFVSNWNKPGVYPTNVTIGRKFWFGLALRIWLFKNISRFVNRFVKLTNIWNTIFYLWSFAIYIGLQTRVINANCLTGIGISN